MKDRPQQPTIILEPPWYRCAHGTEFRSVSGNKPQKCPRTPSCQGDQIEMIPEVDPVFSKRGNQCMNE